MSRSPRFALAGVLCFAFALLRSDVAFSEIAAADGPSEIKSDEQVVFFPTLARLSDDGKTWQADAQGWVFEPERGDLLRNSAIEELRKTFDLDPREPATKIFEQRARLFLVDNERGKRIGIRLAGATFVSDESAADGHFAVSVRVPAEKIAEQLKTSRVVRYEAVLDENDRRTFAGEVHCLAPEGTSIVSDIDDTIKVTEVASKQALLKNTFFREFRAVDGMAELFRGWAKLGYDFHYVSAAPWQLYDPLREFAAAAKFPGGTYHLKRVRLKDETFFNVFADPVEYKLAILEPLLARYPKRRFALVGDSGEEDPEIYGRLARRFPEQVKAIFIRELGGATREAGRYKKAFEGVPGERWALFDDPAKVVWPK